MNIVEISNDFCLNYLGCIRRSAALVGITQSQALCLNSIPFNGISQSDLAKKLSIDISTLSRNLNKLIKLNLIFKNVSTMDQRSFKIKLTEKGERLYGQLLQNVKKELHQVYQQLSLSEAGHLEELLNKLNWQLELLNR